MQWQRFLNPAPSVTRWVVVLSGALVHIRLFVLFCESFSVVRSERLADDDLIELCGRGAAADSAKFVSAYTALGLTPDGSSTYYLAKHVGLLRAKELLLSNRALSAEEACAWGMVNRVVPDDQLRDEAMVLARGFAAGATKA